MAGKETSSSASTGFWIGGLILALVVAGSWLMGQQPSPTDQVSSPLGLLTPPDEPSVATIPDQVVADDAGAEDRVDDQTTLPETPSVSPSFDTLFVDDEGLVVAAGRANPGDQVLIYRNAEVVAQVPSDRRGEWVWTPTTPLPSGSHALQLRVNPDEGRSLFSDPVMVLGPVDTQLASADIAVNGEEEGDGPIPDAVAAGTSDVAIEAAPSPITGPRTVIALGDGDNSVEILQGETAVVAENANSRTTLDTVQWGVGRPLGMTGTGPAGSQLSLAMDGDRLGTVLIDRDGRWRFSTERILAPGPHEVVLRVDGGPPLAFPFNLEPDPVTDTPIAQAGERVIVIEPGNNLWRIAEATYGSGFRYTLIFDANRQKIANPDLIFPGQVFTLPVLGE